MADSKDTYRTVTPYLVVPDADAELAFLKEAFGATEASCQRNRTIPSCTPRSPLATRWSCSARQASSGNPSAALYLWVEDVDGTYARALEAGATSESEPEDKPYGHRNAGVLDRNGITWWIAAPVRKT